MWVACIVAKAEVIRATKLLQLVTKVQKLKHIAL
jgi:hypothetical protein